MCSHNNHQVLCTCCCHESINRSIAEILDQHGCCYKQQSPRTKCTPQQARWNYLSQLLCQNLDGASKCAAASFIASVEIRYQITVHVWLPSWFHLEIIRAVCLYVNDLMSSKMPQHIQSRKEIQVTHPKHLHLHWKHLHHLLPSPILHILFVQNDPNLLMMALHAFGEWGMGP